MSLYTLIIVTFVIFMAINVIIGLRGRKHASTTKDFLTASGQSGIWFIIASAVGASIGSGVVIGTTQYAVKLGVAGAWYAIACGLACIVFALIMSRFVYRNKLVSFSDYFKRRYDSNFIVLLYSGIGPFACAASMGGQLVAAKAIFQAFGIDPTIGLVITAAVMLVYTMFAGLWGSYATAVFQVGVIIVGVLVVGHVDGLSVYFPALALILEIFALEIKSIRRIRLNRHSLLITFLVVFGFFSFVIAGTNRKREKVLAVDQAIYRGDWERVLDLSAGFDSPDILVSYYRNIAFSKKNELPQNLMDHYQRGADALFLPIDLRSSILPVFFSNEVYYQLGDMDMARHRAIEGILFSPKQRSVRQIKRLVEIDMRRGDIEEARKYLNLLDATLFYHSWARSKEEQLKGEETLSMEKRLPRKSDWEREHDILMSISDYLGVLSSLVAEYPENKQALDYLLCYYLLNENLNSFKNAFDTYYKGKFEVVPRLYEEALVQVLSKSSDEEVDGYQIPQDVIEDYQDYIHCKSGRKAKEELRERYSSTYWYYSDYIH